MSNLRSLTDLNDERTNLAQYRFFHAPDYSVFSNTFPSRSNRFSHSDRRSLIHRSATDSPFASIRQVRTLPTFSVRTSPLASKICKCCTTAASVIARGLASFETRHRAFAHSLHHRPASGIAEGVEDAVNVDSLGKHI